ncbi:MAG TPA: universal stress protein [Solirubrobacteraceae bacterium]|nr:universal stress protein [Solirubrobacteraceae bacterium]
MTTTEVMEPIEPVIPAQIERIAAAVNGRPEGDDAAVLGAAITDAVGGDLMLISVEPELPLMLPGASRRRMREETKTMLASTRDSFAPGARSGVDSDLSDARGIKRLVAQEHRQLVVCGSSHRGDEGQVLMGRTTRQLVEHEQCALAIAPHGLSSRGQVDIKRIAVGYDGTPEARAALSLAAAIATGCGARLIVRGVVDDRIPALGWPSLWIEPFRECWDEVMDDEVVSLRTRIEAATAQLSVPISIEVDRDVPSASLLDLSAAADLLVIGSRRWGPLARLVLGGTGEALTHGARCSVLIVPRPDTDS